MSTTARRRRYIVTVTRDGYTRTRDVLMYPSQVERYRLSYERSGYSDISILAKPRNVGVGSTQLLQVRKFEVIPTALEEATELLGIVAPVKVRLHARAGATAGNYRFRGGVMHDIMVKSYKPWDDASKTLWHELAHAEQAERLGWQEFNAQYREQNRTVGYKRNRFEVEARELADTMADVYLTRSL